MSQVDIRTSHVAVGDYTFHVSETGDPGQPTVVFLHGSGPGVTALSNWERVIGDLGTEYHCIAPDVLGFGDSSHPDPPPQGIGAFTQLRVDTLIGLLDVLDVRTTTLVGNSMGGILSMGIIRQDPDRVARLLLMGSAGAPDSFGPQLRKLIKFYDEPTDASMAELMRAFLYDPDFFGDRLKEIAAARLPLALRDDVRRSHLATFDLTTSWHFTEDDVRAITQPTLIIHGREDRFVQFQAALYFFERIPDARLFGIGQCGHWTQIEHHDAFVGACRAFLNGWL